MENCRKDIDKNKSQKINLPYQETILNLSE